MARTPVILALALSLLCAPALYAADAGKAGTEPAKSAPATDSQTAPQSATATKPAPAPQAGPQESTLTLVPTTTDIVITFPLVLVERGIVQSVDAAKNTFVLKRHDGTTATVQVDPNTIIENVYLDVFSYDSSLGIKDLKAGEKVRARVLPAQNGVEAALLVDVFHWS